MADNQKAIELNSAIATCYNQYFTWNNNSAFYILAPTYLFQFYNNNVRVWDEWNNGWVGNFHSIKKGILPTQFAGSLCQKIGDLIYGDGVLFESTAEKNVKNDALDFVGEIDNKIDIKNTFKDSILKSAQLGNSLLKWNADGNGELWLDALAGNRFFVDLDSRGNVVGTRCYINLYTGGVKQKDGKQDSFGLVEERYYDADDDGNYRLDANGERVPMLVYKVYKLNAPANMFESNPSGLSIPFDDLPRQVKRALRSEYGDLPLDEPQQIEGFKTLGVYLVKYTNYVSNIPNIKLGESCLAKILNYLPKYDAIDSEETIDLRISRPKVIVPDFMSRGEKGNTNALDSYDDVVFNKIPNKSDKDQTPITFIPTPREEHFIRLKEDVIKKICGQLGIATSSLFSDIADGRGNVTATEISSENSNTTLFQTNKRKIMLGAFNDCVRDMLVFYGYEPNVKVAFTPAGSSNKTVMVKNTVALDKSGLQSKYQSIKELHPEWSDKQVTAELEELGGGQEKEPLKQQNDNSAKA